MPYLDLKEFIEILKQAKDLNVYGYANLNIEYLPYVFVTLINFIPRNSYRQRRKLKFFFYYENRIQSFEDLWIDKGISSDLFRISYDNGITQKVTKIETSTDYLTEESTFMSDNQKQ